jgi:endonuclease/exonuclease/phosphatase family metal-dependent hydrolase
MIRLASYNVENLFQRARVLNRNEWIDSEGNESRMTAARAILDATAKLNQLLAEPVYTAAIRSQILAALDALGLLQSDETKFVILRRNRGDLLRRPKDGSPVEIVANGRTDWIGWVELKTEAVSEIATENTARVIANVHADILAVVEVENRTSLMRFDEQVLRPTTNLGYDHILLIDGNDERGIDVGMLTRNGVSIDFVRSHVDDLENGERIFSRDCPEYHLKLPSGDRLIVLVNHLKSKGYGDPATSNAKRKMQAQRIREIYDELIGEGHQYVAIVGDLNDFPESDPMTPLLGNSSTLRDISEHADFDFSGRPGTYGNGTISDKIDYVLLSPALFGRARGGAIYRAGVWGGKNGDLFPHLPEITKPAQAASDHAAIYADFDF